MAHRRRALRAGAGRNGSRRMAGANASVPVSQLIRTFVKRSQDSLQDLLESVSHESSDVLKRRQLLRWYESRRQQLIRLLVIVKWISRSNRSIDGLQAVNSVLDTREQHYTHSVHALKLMSRRVDERLYPVWDVTTALHVMTSGSYRLLPKVIETEVPFATALPPELVSSTLTRLNDQLHTRLLSTNLPPAFTRIRVHDGMAYLCAPAEFEIGVSLRMTVQTNPPKPEADRIRWTLFQLNFLCKVRPNTLSVDAAAGGSGSGSGSAGSAGSSASSGSGNGDDDTTSGGSDPTRQPQSFISSTQIAALLDFGNRILFHAPHQSNALTVLYERLHQFVLHTTLDTLAAQSRAFVARLTAANAAVSYAKHSHLTVTYWPAAPLIPVSAHERARQIGLSSSLAALQVSSLSASNAAVMQAAATAGATSAAAGLAAAQAATATVAANVNAASRRMEDDDSALAERERKRAIPINFTICLDDPTASARARREQLRIGGAVALPPLTGPVSGTKQLSVRCYPPLPAMEDADSNVDAATSSSAAPVNRFAIDPSDIHLVRLSSALLREHANERTIALYQYLMDCDSDERAEALHRHRMAFFHLSPTAVAAAATGVRASKSCYERIELIDPAAAATGSSSAAAGSAPLILRIALVRDYILHVQTELQSGRFAFSFGTRSVVPAVSAALNWLRLRVNNDSAKGGGLPALRGLLAQLRIQCVMADVKALLHAIDPFTAPVSAPPLVWPPPPPLKPAAAAATASPAPAPAPPPFGSNAPLSSPFGKHAVYLRVARYPQFWFVVDARPTVGAADSNDSSADAAAAASASANSYSLLDGCCTAEFYLLQISDSSTAPTITSAAATAAAAAANALSRKSPLTVSGRSTPIQPIAGLGGSVLSTIAVAPAIPAAPVSSSRSDLASGSGSGSGSHLAVVAACIKLKPSEIRVPAPAAAAGEQKGASPASTVPAEDESIRFLRAVRSQCERMAPICLLSSQLYALRLPHVPVIESSTASAAVPPSPDAPAFTFTCHFSGYLSTRAHMHFMSLIPVAGATPSAAAGSTATFEVSISLPPKSGGGVSLQFSVRHPLFARIVPLLRARDDAMWLTMSRPLTAAANLVLNPSLTACAAAPSGSSGSGSSGSTIQFTYGGGITPHSVETWIRDFTALLALGDIALSLDDYSINPAVRDLIARGAATPSTTGLYVPPGFFQVIGLSPSHMLIQFPPAAPASASSAAGGGTAVSVPRVQLLLSRRSGPASLLIDSKQTMAHITFTFDTVNDTATALGPVSKRRSASSSHLQRCWYPQRLLWESAWNTNGNTIGRHTSTLIASSSALTNAGWMSIAHSMYWSHAALHVVSTFVRACEAFDAPLNVQHTLFGGIGFPPTFANATPATVNAMAPVQSQSGGMGSNRGSAVHTVSTICQSDTRLSIIYRLNLQIRLEIRMLNANRVLIATAAPTADGSGGSSAGARAPPSTSYRAVAMSELSNELWMWYRRCGKLELMHRANQVNAAALAASAAATGARVPCIRCAFRAFDESSQRRAPIELIVSPDGTTMPTAGMAATATSSAAVITGAAATVDTPLQRDILIRYFDERVAGAMPYWPLRISNFYRMLGTLKSELIDLIGVMALELKTNEPPAPVALAVASRGDTKSEGGATAGSRVRLCLDFHSPLDVQYSREQEIIYFVCQFEDRASGGGGGTLYVPLAFYWPQNHLGLWIVDSRHQKVPKQKVPITIPTAHPLHVELTTLIASNNAKLAAAKQAAASGVTAGLVLPAPITDDSVPLPLSIRYLASLPFQELASFLNRLTL